MDNSVSDILKALGIGIQFGDQSSPVERPLKGSSLISFPDDFVVVDIETTGLMPAYDEIIEVAALRIRNNAIVDTYQSLVKPENKLSEFVEQLTGITNEMLSGAPGIGEVIPAFKAFVGDDVIIGHNVNFDINFLYDASRSIIGEPLKNDYIDTMRISRKALPDLEHHRLQDISAFLGVKPDGFHRAMCDCHTAFGCYEALKKRISADPGIDEFVKAYGKHKEQLDLRKIKTENTEFDKTHPFYGKHCVFTGALDRMQRAEAAQLVVNLGGICDNNVTKKTNYLILGNNDYCSTIKDGKSAKQKRAEEYKLKGADIEIIPENVFYELVIEE